MSDSADQTHAQEEDATIKRSGGVNADAEQINVGGSVVGRDNVAAEKIVYGDEVTYQAPERSLLRPTPPAPPAHFTGREAALNNFAQPLTSGESVAITALHGMGGIGKTALAQKLAERVKDHFTGGVLWWSLGPQPDVLTALDVWARHADAQTDLSALPDAAARAALVRAMLEPLGKLLAIIDDVWDAESANILKEVIPAGNPILITTRDGDLAKVLRCRVERIDKLNEDEAVALLKNLLGSLGEYEPAARQIAKLTEGLPLALELVAGLADAPSDLVELEKKLRDKPMLDILKLPGGEVRELNIEACLAMSYSNGLDADLQRRFRALGVFAPAPFEPQAIAAVWGDADADEGAVAQALQRLTRRHLLTKEGDEYRQHALLRAYALALLNAANETEDAARAPRRVLPTVCQGAKLG